MEHGREAESGETADPAKVRVARNGGDLNSPVAVSLTFGGTSSKGTDYTATPDTPVSVFAQAEVTLDVTLDRQYEPTETVVVGISSSSDYVIGSPATATVNLANLPVRVRSLTVDGATQDGVTQSSDPNAPANWAAVKKPGQHATVRATVNQDGVPAGEVQWTGGEAVPGDRRTYKIHLGSGNILMEPNDQYLCIVPDRSTAAAGGDGGAVFLPFEGDATLSVILSKAFLLADDAAITDPTIVRQVEGR